MKQAVIFCNGDIRNYKTVLQEIRKADFIICADGGLRHCLKLGLTPHVVIGDFDSLPKNAHSQVKKKYIEWIRYPKDKNQTDAELALDLAVKKRCSPILIFGALGSRIDHFLALLLHLATLTKQNITITTEDQTITVLKRKIVLKGRPGDLFSLIPLVDTYGISIIGARYGLDNETLTFGTTRGVSNEFMDTKVVITVRSGKLLIIQSITKQI